MSPDHSVFVFKCTIRYNIGISFLSFHYYYLLACKCMNSPWRVCAFHSSSLTAAKSGLNVRCELSCSFQLFVTCSQWQTLACTAVLLHQVLVHHVPCKKGFVKYLFIRFLLELTLQRKGEYCTNLISLQKLANLSCTAPTDPTHMQHAVQIQPTEGLSHFGHLRHYRVLL